MTDGFSLPMLSLPPEINLFIIPSDPPHWELYWELFYSWVWASIGLVLGKSWASLGQVLGKSWASLRQVLGKACSPALHPGEGEMDRITNHFTKIMMWNKAPEMTRLI